MASVRQTKTGKWEVTLKHKLLPKRLYFTFDDEAAARAYGENCARWLKAGVVPKELVLEPEKPEGKLGPLMRAWINTGRPSPSDVELLERMFTELSGVALVDFTYKWAELWVYRMKVERNLAPGSLRKCTGALARCIDHHLRGSKDLLPGNPLRSLPDGYSRYTDQEVAAAQKLNGKVKHDVVREHRMVPEVEQRVVAVLSGEKRPDRERAFTAPDIPAVRLLMAFVIDTGARLREAYTITWGQLDFNRKVVKIRSSKLRRGQVVRFREVPMKPVLHAQLLTYKPEVVGGEMLVFPFWDGQVESLKRTSNRLSVRFGAIFDYAGCPEITEHDLRHEATCRWYELRGKDGHWIFRHEEICRIMGWTPGSPMAQRYASFRGEDLADRLWAAQ